MKHKIHISVLLVFALCVNVFAQTQIRNCGTPNVNVQYENLIQQKIINYLNQNNNSANTIATIYQIPVIVHVIHSGEPVGTFPNIAQGQINSQIQVLNDDYAGNGFNSNLYPTAAFTNFASNGLISAASKDGLGRIGIANTEITFCLALKDSLGNILAEPGIDRVDWNSIGALANPTVPTVQSNFTTLMDNTIKPATIWNPTKYLNIWVTDASPTVANMIAVSKFPPLSGVAGLSGGSTNITDGVWIYAKCFGSANIFPSGVYHPTYKFGRTATHEIGHCLGLRHIWGDASCATDYCIDTPPAANSNFGLPSYPYNANTCLTPTGVNNTIGNGLNGEMFMNFMDFTDDPGMYMFTNDQKIRMQTVMANSPYRNQLGTHGLCTAPTTVVANFSLSSSSIIQGQSVNITDLSTSTAAISSWNYSCIASVPATSTLQNPTLTFNTIGVHTISLTVNSAGVNASATKTIQVSACPTPTLNASVINPTCNGMCNGSASVVTLGGAPFTYTWVPAVSSTSLAINLCASASNYICTVTNSCGVSNSKIITVTEPPALNASISASGLPVCAGNTATLSSTTFGGISPYTFNWNTGANAANIIITPTISPITAYTLTVSDSQGCSTVKSFNASVNPNPTITITPSIQTICSGSSAVLTASGAVNYSWSSGSILSSIVVAPTLTTSYSVVGTNSFSCSKSASTTVNVVNKPIVTINSPTLICFGYTTNIAANGALNYLWHNGSTTNTTTIQPFITTTYSVVGINAGNCSDTAFVTVYTKPLPLVNASSAPTIVCTGNLVNLDADGTAITYTWMPGFMQGPIQSVSLSTPTTFTVYGQGSNGCIFLDTIFVDVISGTSAKPIVTPTVICKGDSAQLSVQNGFVSAWPNNPTVVPTVYYVKPNASQSFIFSATDNNTCKGDITFNVRVDETCELIVYNGFSPNGDGINDFWFIDNIEKFPNNEVYIFNRWGNKLYHTNQYNNVTNRWDGKINGVSITSGTYFYTILSSEGRLIRKGWLEVTN